MTLIFVVHTFQRSGVDRVATMAENPRSMTQQITREADQRRDATFHGLGRQCLNRRIDNVAVTGRSAERTALTSGERFTHFVRLPPQPSGAALVQGGDPARLCGSGRSMRPCNSRQRTLHGRWRVEKSLSRIRLLKASHRFGHPHTTGRATLSRGCGLDPRGEISPGLQAAPAPRLR